MTKPHFNQTHGMKGTPEWIAWQNMKSRCNNPNHISYKYYGAIGITYCDRWKSFEHFFSDMGYRPSKNYSLDRIDGSKMYCPRNCQWSTAKQQAHNRKNNVRLTYNGKTMLMIDWSKETGFSCAVIHGRLKRGWTIKETLTLKPSLARRINRSRPE